nr:MAG TPA: hypothetical protein [Caudoviricetes sp.]
MVFAKRRYITRIKLKLIYHRSSVVFCCLKRSDYGSVQTDIQNSFHPT